MTIKEARSEVVSSFTIIKGSLIDETYAAFADWNFDESKRENLERIQESSDLGARTANWSRDVRKVLNRRFDPTGRDRPLVELAKADCDREVWRPLLLWHMTRDEFLVRDFIIGWLHPRYLDGTYRIAPSDVVPYLNSLASRPGAQVAEAWKPATTERVATGLLRIAADFRLLSGGATKEFASYHLPDESFLYLLQAIAENATNASQIVESEEWGLFLMDQGDVERELLRLHQYDKVEYEVAGSVVSLKLTAGSPLEFARKLIHG